MNLNSLLGYDESVEIEPVLSDELPDVMIDYEMVMERSLENSKFDLENEINILNAQSAVAKAKADRGVSMTLTAKFGLSNTAPSFNGVYRKPLDQEVAGLTFNVPIFDWGLEKEKSRRRRPLRPLYGHRYSRPKTIIAETYIPQLDNSITSAVNVKSRAVPRK